MVTTIRVAILKNKFLVDMMQGFYGVILNINSSEYLKMIVEI